MAAHPGKEWLDRATSVALKAGDVIKQADGTFHYIQYVNSSGAYAVPLAAVTREIKGNVVSFTAGGKTISTWSLVERINPLSMGGNSQEYKRYVTMAKASKESKAPKESKAGKAKKIVGYTNARAATQAAPAVQAMDTAQGVTGVGFGEFAGEEAGGHTASPPMETVSDGVEDTDMAKKSKASKVKKARTPKPPKTVRKCACSCGAETSGYFTPGHDAKLHGWIAKLADGRLEPKDIPAGVRSKLTLVQTKSGFRATTPNFYKD